MLKQLWRDQRGGMAIMFAMAITIAIAASTIVIDAASLYYDQRRMQSAVDIAAITAAGDPTRAHILAQGALVNAGLLAPGTTTGLTVTPGRYDPSLSDIDNRFVARQQPFNAVDVRLDRPGTLYFAQNLIPVPVLSASGTASMIPEAAFSIGSRLASLNEGIANTLLSSLLGTKISLEVADYEALLGAKLELLTFLDALAQELKLTAGTYNDLLATEAPAGTIAKVLSTLTSGTAKTVLTALGTVSNSGSIPLGKVFSVGRLGELAIGDARAVTGLNLSAMEILGAAATVGNGQRSISLNVGANVPGLTKLTVDLAVGDAPNGGAWFRIGPTGTLLRTAQVRLYIKAELLGLFGILGLATVKLPIWIEVAHSEARLASITCPSSASPKGTAGVAVTPGVVRVGLSDLPKEQINDMSKRPAAKWVELVGLLGLLGVDGFVDVNAAQATPVNLAFTSNDIANGVVHTADTKNITSTLANEILTNLQLRIDLPLFSPLSINGVTKIVKDLVRPLVATLDMIVDGVLSIVGIKVGEADVRVYGVRCGNAALIR